MVPMGDLDGTQRGFESQEESVVPLGDLEGTQRGFESHSRMSGLGRSHFELAHAGLPPAFFYFASW